METKRIVVLANSRRPGGHCVAGVEIARSGRPRWIRPIGDRADGEVRDSERTYRDGSEIALLDIADIDLLEHRPNDYQPENWVIGTAERWRRAGSLLSADLANYVQAGGPLWINGSGSADGSNNRVAPEEARSLGSSLRLIEVSSWSLEVYTKTYSGKRKVRAAFDWAGESYLMDVTDPEVEARYISRKVGSYDGDDAYLTISLTSPFHDYCYKLVAAVIPKASTA
jgi:Dual OB-containing domain